MSTSSPNADPATNEPVINGASNVPETASQPLDFVRKIVVDDCRTGKWNGRVVTRFPPEPNGYLHIGHAKSICLNFGVALDYQGKTNLRYDDTNPTKEDIEYVESIERDVRWLGFEPTAVLFSADYFPKMYELAERLVREGKAYVDDLSDEQIKNGNTKVLVKNRRVVPSDVGQASMPNYDKLRAKATRGFDLDAGAYAPVPGRTYGARVPAFHALDLRVDKSWLIGPTKLVAYLAGVKLV